MLDKLFDTKQYRSFRANVPKIVLHKLFLMLFTLVVIHVASMMIFEDMAFENAVWFALTTTTTVGYGDYTAVTLWGRIATIILIYFGGVATFAQVVAMYSEYRTEIREHYKSGKGSWKMKKHIVFLNCPETNWEEYYQKLISQLRESKVEISKIPAIIVGKKFTNGLPEHLKKMDVVHITGEANDPVVMKSASIEHASIVVILAKSTTDANSDSISFDLIHRIREKNKKVRIITEVVMDENRHRLMDAGANNVLRPIRTYPELIARSILAPGSEQVIETLFDSFDEECVRYDIPISGRWDHIITTMVKNNAGIPVAYLDEKEKIHINSKCTKHVRASALYVITNHENMKETPAIKRLLKKEKLCS